MPLAPPIRHLLHQYGLSPDDVTGTGQDGRITRDDVLKAAGESRAGGPEVVTHHAPAVEPVPPPPSRPRVTPRARRLARERGIDVAALSGADHVVTSAQVETAPVKRAKPVDRTAAMRKATAALMGRAAREIPHYYVAQTFDLTATLDWLKQANAGRKPRDRVLPAVLFLRAAVIAAQRVPELNGHWTEQFEPADGVDLGVAVATRSGGLVTPRIVGAQDLDLSALMAHLTDLVKRAKAGRLRGTELQPGSITVSSLADGGPDALYGVIYPPQVALVGIGAVAQRPWVVDGELAVRSTVTVTLAADHRATDGRTGARWLTVLGEALTNPEEL
jgi:pyruvate dehydrogenase E2 component (dihydrolipoamide acetyltransferase)